MLTKKDIIKKNEYLWEIPKLFRADMRVPARIYVDEKLLQKVFADRSLEQLVNVATLPGIINHALAMPDIHEGYGFPIGGVAAMDMDEGIISPGGVGYDINCGVRLLASQIKFSDLQKYTAVLLEGLLRGVPSGVGRGGGIKLDKSSLKNVLEKGVKYVVEKGYGVAQDIEHCEEQGTMSGALDEAVSAKAKERGSDQLGTLGAGNHFLEVQKVEEIFDEEVASIFGLFKDQVTVAIHCGSRGLGHQVATDYVGLMLRVAAKYKIKLADPELACAPIASQEGRNYFAAMAGAANFAWANRQLITHSVRKIWQKVLGSSAGPELSLIYDVAHNIAKFEKFENQEICVHRKGATRALGPGRQELPKKYQLLGQPVLIPGTMGTASYVLVGTQKAEETFYSVCHGAGRVLSRHAAIRARSGQAVKKELEEQGIVVRSLSPRSLAEEAPLAYKDIKNVVEVIEKAGLAKKVARLRPMGVMKG
ncbi:RtcB family protein [Patescibacteria group bacterium]|nr:RtcB family protein [Patescibacteria group bacterium]